MSVYDLIVIGGGAGGLVSAGFAATLGVKTALISDSPLGGECLYTGCVPSKALLHAAKAARVSKADNGFSQAMAAVKQAITDIEPHDSPEHIQDAYGVSKIIQGRAAFVDPHTVEVNGEQLKARKFVIATGASVFIPKIDGLNEVDYWTHETIFDQVSQTKSLAIIGGGPIGVEMGQAFQRLGTQVHLIQRGGRILPKDEPEASGCIQDVLQAEGVQLYLNQSPVQVKAEGENMVLTLNTTSGETSTLTIERLLIATGKKPLQDPMRLDKAGVEFIPGKGIPVDERCRTSASHIWSVGDVTSRFQFTHYAEHQAKVAITNGFLKWPMTMESRVVPWVTYTDPEVAHVGMVYEAAKQHHQNILRLRIDLDVVDRFIVEQETKGFAEILVKPDGEILGATLVCVGAGELIHEVVLAMQQKIKIQALADVIHAYPTRSDLWKLLANEYSKKALLNGWKKSVVSWWARL
ncbi:MAG: FAD-dependent oxidoreductase [Vampirovibrio sp.]|nr:FAD-dependent oxidoreductase [Vampirovibrio sp.]